MEDMIGGHPPGMPRTAAGFSMAMLRAQSQLHVPPPSARTVHRQPSQSASPTRQNGARVETQGKLAQNVHALAFIFLGTK